MPAVRALVFAVLVVVVPRVVAAQIYEWRDDSGARHFTNEIEDVPESQREGARVIVRAGRVAADAEPARVDEAPAAVAAAAPRESRAAPDRRMAQVVYDRSHQWRRPQPTAAPPQPVVQDVHVNIAGPLSVSEVVVAPEFSAAAPAYYPWYAPYVGPRVATSFDRGRSRHRTVRMRLQEQFQYDRNGPSLYVTGPVPLGPRFSAQLPRGLRPSNCGRTAARRRVTRSSAPRRLAARR